MTVYQLLTKLGEAGIKLWVESGELRFRAPKGALTPELRDQVVAQKPELIKFLQQSRSGEAVKQRKIQAVSRAVPIPLSFGQERLWFLSQLEPESSAYHIPILLELKGNLDAHKLDAALGEVIKRHEVLRSVLQASDNATTPGVSQQILPQAHWPLHCEDFSHYDAEDKEKQRLKVIEATRSTVFSLCDGPLLRTVLIKLEEQHYQLILTLHHIISDGWSMAVLVKELMALYLAQINTDLALSKVLPPLVVQYGDYAHWQRQWLVSSAREQQLAYWREQLDEVPVLELPLDKPRPAALRSRGDAHFFYWSKELQKKARDFSQTQGVTLFMTLLAAFEALLSSYSGQNDFAVGTPIANRTMPEQEPLIGFFVNTLALRAEVDQQQSFETLLKTVQRITLEAYAHQDLPFEQVVEALNVPREMSYTPLFQVMFSLQNESDIQLDLPGLQINTLPLSRRSSKCDLNLTFTETAEGLRGELEYSTELFDPESIIRMESHLQHLVENLLAAPQVPLCRVSMLSQEGKQNILSQWNPQASSDQKSAMQYGLAALFEKQVEQFPQAIALVSGTTQLTYDSLNQHANDYAHKLLETGLKSDQVVALCGSRSLERIIALLAIVKAGAVYMPLETDQSAERLATLLGQSQATFAIVDSQQRAVFLTLSADDLPITLHPYPAIKDALVNGNNLGLPASPEQRAYIMFTSGSTGEPKGIVIPQRGIVRLVKDNGFLELGPETCLLHYAPLAFDASTFEIWGTLLNGGRLVVAPAGLLELEQLGEEIHQHGVNTLWLTAALFHAMAEHNPQSFAPLKTLLAGGDQLNPHTVKRVLYRYPRLTLINGYGPTENTTFTSCHVMHSADQVGRSVSIGKAINGTQIYVLNHALEPQAVGVPGELCTAGDGLALGYLSTEATASAFMPNPFAHLPGHGSTLYKTGDQVRYLPDGSLEFLGRIDQQVKIRGFRIELGEIEASLSGLPWVKNCAVVVQEKDQQKYLVAYLESGLGVETAQGVGNGLSVENGVGLERSVALESDQAALIRRTRSQLSRLLPDYMQPAAYTVLAALPLTRNGKVDRKALPPVTIGGQAKSDDKPSTELEAELCSIWQAVLNSDEVGIHDNFFELGGHSLLATQVTSRVRKKLGYELPVREMFACPTIAQCAAWIEEHGQHSTKSLQGELVKRAEGETTPATYAQRRLWLLEQLSPGSSAYLIPSALRIRGPLDMHCVNQVVNTLIARHETLRTAIIAQDESDKDVQLLQQVFDDVSVQCEREIYTGELSPKAIQQLIDEEAGNSFDLSQAPLMRVRFLALDKNKEAVNSEEQDTLLLLTMHHIISDGWSMSVFINEFTVLYDAFRHHRENPLAPLAFQYGDYACWQQRCLDPAHLQSALDFWVEQLSDKDPVLHLPTDFQRPTTPSSPGAMLHHTLPVSLTQSLSALSEREGVSLFMLALSAWQLLLSRYSGQTKFNVGSPVAGRTMTETEPMIGFFINTVVFGANVEENLSFREYLYQVREKSLAGFAHQNLPFEMLVDTLQPKRSLSHSPLFQVFLNVLNLPAVSRDVDNLHIEDLSEEQKNYAAKFDLSLYVQPQEEGLKLSMLYRSDCFEAETVQRHLAHLESLFTQMVDDLDRPLAAFRLLQQADKHLLPAPLKTLAVKDFPLPQQQISAQAVERGENVALLDLDGSWRYNELEQWSNQLAHALQQGGIKPEAPVVIYAHRSGALVCALLAVLKAGGAFVVLDPAHPELRLLQTIEQVKAEAVLNVEGAGPLPSKLAAAFSGLPLHLAVPALSGWRNQNPFAGYSIELPEAQTNHLG
ncbi:MAG: amino acid adenylation domain-containing protein, partial [Pseudomonadales bacterium]|nr:amino acid adenylation domain-containing protein [Pseudomonadales bacterium]